jgi:hypothetical protein
LVQGLSGALAWDGRLIWLWLMLLLRLVAGRWLAQRHRQSPAARCQRRRLQLSVGKAIGGVENEAST